MKTQDYANEVGLNMYYFDEPLIILFGSETVDCKKIEILT